MKFLLILIGVLLLVPGVCGGIATVVTLFDPGSAHVLLISLPSLAAGVGGIFLIKKAFRDC